jgi:hypothetical protein
MLDPKYRGFVPIPKTAIARPLIGAKLRKTVYAFVFGERGLIGGLSLLGTKITPIHPDGRVQ